MPHESIQDYCSFLDSEYSMLTVQSRELRSNFDDRFQRYCEYLKRKETYLRCGMYSISISWHAGSLISVPQKGSKS